MSFYVGDGGQHRLVKEVYAGDGGQHRLVKEAWVGEGGQWRKFFQLSPVTNLVASEDYTRCPLGFDWEVTVTYQGSATIIVEKSVGGGAWSQIDSRSVTGSGSYSFTETGFNGSGPFPEVSFRAYSTEFGTGSALVFGPVQPFGCP